MNVVIILAAGASTRFSQSVPKQYAPISGKMIFEWAVEAFLSHEAIDKVLLVVSEEHRQYYEKSKYVQNGMVEVCLGGGSRNESTFNALMALVGNNVNCVLIHDAARPFVTQKIISDCIHSMSHARASDTCVPPTDTIVEWSRDSRELAGIPDRSRLLRGQTPQTFNYDFLCEAYEHWAAVGRPNLSDDCSVVLQRFPGEKISIVDGDDINFKITSSIDIITAEATLQAGKVTAFGSPDAYSVPRRVAIIGGTDGIGAGVAEELSNLGSDVAIFSRRNGFDIRSSKAIEEGIVGFANAGGLDGLVISAGILKHGSFLGQSQEEVDELIDVNFKAVVGAVRALAHLLIENKGSIVLFSSSSFSYGRAGTAVYSATKAGIANFTQALAQELSDVGVRVNCIVPRRVNTSMRRENFPNEDLSTNLEADVVAKRTVELMKSNLTGQLIHIR